MVLFFSVYRQKFMKFGRRLPIIYITFHYDNLCR